MPLVDYSASEGIATITLTNAPANTYSYQMMREIDDAVLTARFDDDVHVILIRGEGDRFFCAGADIAMLDAVTPGFKYAFCLHANETMLRLEHTPKLVIAALNGHTVGGGLEIAMACDIRLGKAGGGKVGLPEVKLGVLPGTGGTQRLARLIGKAKALEMMVLGQNVAMEQAQELGIINAVLPADGWWDHVLDYARQFTPPGHAAMAVGRIKRSVQSGAEVPLESGLALERELQQQLFNSHDAGEGISAYNEKRKPEFKGA